ncbi:hypothetical protein MKX03_017710 [Papaver bracteatum]|nr:hypothetical protein MKX03_017710 [Papaver bracteatum]
MEAIQRRTSTRKKTKPVSLYDEALSLDQKKKRTMSCLDNKKKKKQKTERTEAAIEDFDGPEYKLDLSNKNDKEKEKDGKKKSARPDLKTLSKASRVMKKTNTILFPQKQIGPVPGVDVGDHFLTRCEMSVIGLHDHHVNGIEYMCKDYEKEYKDYTFPIAVSVVLSGKYEDNIDKGDEVTYIGQGANDLKGNCQQMHDQEEKAAGNLALKNSCAQHVPVRFIRGHKPKGGKTGRTYSYDGLYKVVKYWEEKGASRYNVLKFQLKRLKGQPPLTSKQVTYCRRKVPKITQLPGLVSEDISNGEEAIPIPATNLIDPPLAPTGNLHAVDEFSKMHAGFQYLKSMQLGRNVNLPVRTSGCGCGETCTDPTVCDCAKLNGVDFPYVSNKGGRLVVAKSVVYECGPLCGCGPGCVNRSSQRGIKFELEVFRTPNKGWAVRSHDFIPVGAPVCEYTGVVRRTRDVKKTDNADYMFEIDTFQTMHGLDGRQQRVGDAAKSSCSLTESDKKKLKSNPEFCIDGSEVGNVARFINHSCDGNLFVQSVLSSHHDPRLARLMLFASENIRPLQELTYDYGYPIDRVLNADGSKRVIECHCSKPKCRGRVC